MWHDGMGWGMAFGGVWMVLFWGALIGFGVWAVTRLSKRDSSESKVNHIEIVKERYAKGEISKEEYDEKKKGLTSEHGDWVLDMLKARYAKGDIGKEEFEQIKKDLS